MGLFDFIKTTGEFLESTSTAAYRLFMQKLPGKNKENESNNPCMRVDDRGSLREKNHKDSYEDGVIIRISEIEEDELD